MLFLVVGYGSFCLVLVCFCKVFYCWFNLLSLWKRSLNYCFESILRYFKFVLNHIYHFILSFELNNDILECVYFLIVLLLKFFEIWVSLIFQYTYFRLKLIDLFLIINLNIFERFRQLFENLNNFLCSLLILIHCLRISCIGCFWLLVLNLLNLSSQSFDLLC